MQGVKPHIGCELFQTRTLWLEEYPWSERAAHLRNKEPHTEGGDPIYCPVETFRIIFKTLLLLELWSAHLSPRSLESLFHTGSLSDKIYLNFHPYIGR